MKMRNVFCLQSSSADVSPSATPSSTPLGGTHAPKYGTVIPNRIFVGGIAANVSCVYKLVNKLLPTRKFGEGKCFSLHS